MFGMTLSGSTVQPSLGNANVKSELSSNVQEHPPTTTHFEDEDDEAPAESEDEPHVFKVWRGDGDMPIHLAFYSSPAN